VPRRLLFAYGCRFFLAILLRTAWLSDHAYLALRTADNAAWGLGFRWNPAERVQVFEGPLWMLGLYLARVVTGEVYYGTLVLSMACALGATWLLLRQAATPVGVVVAALVLALSPTFVSYSTSGLGTPLAHVLVVAFAVAVWNPAEGGFQRRRRLALAVAALAALTDPLTLLITLPVIAGQSPLAARDGGQPSSDAGGVSPLPRSHGGLSPISLAIPIAALLLWAALAIYYYGSLVPMATLARLNQLTLADRLHAGVAFLADIVHRDPILVATLIAGLALPFVRHTSKPARSSALDIPGERAAGSAVFPGALRATDRYADPQRGRNSRWGPHNDLTLAAGALLYTAAIVTAGGSTWSGYGLTVPFVIAVFVIARQPALASRRVAAPALAVVGIIAALTPISTFASHAQYGLDAQPQAGIVDPRLQDYQATGLLRVRRNQWFPDHPESVRGLQAGEAHRAIASSPRPGFFGYAAGRNVHVIDPTGSGDPLLARLHPASPVAPGHSVMELRPRTPPDGYLESLATDRNAIADPALAAFYERVRLATRGSLQERGRAFNAALLAFDRVAPGPSACGRN
jgi:hypothetical protein